MLLERGTIYMVPGDRGGCDQVRQEAEAFRYSFNNPLPPTINSRNAPPSLPEPIEKLAAGCANQLFAVSLGFFFLFFFIFTLALVISCRRHRCDNCRYDFCVPFWFSAVRTFLSIVGVANGRNCESGGELITGSLSLYTEFSRIQSG